MPVNDDELDYLLSRGRLSGERRRKIFSELEGPAKRRRLLRLIPAGVAALAAAAGAVLVLRPHAEEPALRTKGAGQAGALEVACLGASLSACPRGSRLAFSIAEKGGYFVTAYAEPVDPPDPQGRIWYLTNEPSGSIAPGSTDGTHVLARGARVGPEHGAGTYRVELLVTRRTLTREEAAAGPREADVVSRASFDMRVPP